MSQAAWIHTRGSLSPVSLIPVFPVLDVLPKTLNVLGDLAVNSLCQLSLLPPACHLGAPPSTGPRR